MRLKKIIIKDYARIGNNATLIPGIVVGKNSLVGAGSVVLSNVLDGKVVLGNPARVMWNATKIVRK